MAQRKILDSGEWLQALQSFQHPAQSQILLMYSTYWKAYVDDPRLMVIPMEDHQVHRGDGVFEAVKVCHGKIYMLKEHLDRLAISAEALSLSWALPRKEVEEILNEMVQLKKIQTGAFRIFLSRGAGTFSPNPYDSVGSQFHFILTTLKAPSDEKFQNGAKMGRSHVAPKPSPWAGIKSCNYLPNVMMKKEAVDRGLDFTVGFDEDGFVTESSTENLVVLNSKNELCRPHLRRILKGTTMIRTFELADQLVKSGEIKAVVEKNISEKEISEAKELMVIGTTWDVLPVTEYESKKIGSGKSGPIAQKLLQILRDDQKA